VQSGFGLLGSTTAHAIMNYLTSAEDPVLVERIPLTLLG
jgi:hypothetical protein